jgi:outer membrane murein-binding lipoprotein Lpp
MIPMRLQVASPPGRSGTRVGAWQSRRARSEQLVVNNTTFADTETIEMTRLHRIAPAAAVTIGLLALGGCATKGDIESLRTEIAGLRSSIASVDAKATRAEASAQAAEASASAASAKADQIFRAGLRK